MYNFQDSSISNVPAFQMAGGQRVLTLEDIERKAPSVFATHAWEGVSEKYKFIPTFEVVQALVEQGFMPVSAAQGKCRIEGKSDFTRHVVRFLHRDFDKPTIVGQAIPQIVLMNSHDRASAYKLSFGLYRLVCKNGLMVDSGNVCAVSARHSGRNDLVQQVIDASFEVIEQAPKVASQVEEWRNRLLSPSQQEAFANAALELRDTTLKAEPVRLLSARRGVDAVQTDGSRDIWTTMNVVQENLVRGGQWTRNARGSVVRTRAINSVNEDTKFNRALWRLTEELAKAV